MTNREWGKQDLAERLLQAEGLGGDTSTGRQPSGAGTAFLEILLAREQATEQRLRRAAVGSWGALLALVPLLGIAFFVVRVGGGLIVEITRAAVIVVGIFSILALFLAVVTTVAWLWRSRTPSLAVIERRLAALEELLRRDVS